MKKRNSWDAYLKQQLKNPKVRQAFEEESRILDLGIALAKSRASRGLTQEAVAKRIGTSAPQISRTEKAPENANVKTLMRYADAIGMELKVKLVPRSGYITGGQGKRKRTPRKSVRMKLGKQSSEFKVAAMRRA
jgi:transcriptional regulator with XRE-family HTH domain